MPKGVVQLALSTVALMMVIFGGILGYGVFTVWYRSTGYLEQNQPSLKPQEAPGYAPMPAVSIMTTGKEPDVTTRNQARRLRNPVAPTGESIGAGKELYITYCSPCHGISGDGRGLMGSVPLLKRAPDQENRDLARYLSGYLGYTPGVDLNFVQEEPDGELYYTITNGGEAIMPSFRDAMSPEQRWDLINYIKRGLGGPFGG